MAPTTATPPPGDSDSRRVVYLALIGFTVAVGAVTFVLSFVGLRDYGIRVAQMDPWLASLIPFGVDVLSLCGIAATFLLRHAAWHRRAYAWLVFAVPVALSVAGNLSHANAKGLSTSGHVGSGVWPILLALASHLVIVVRRDMERRRENAKPAATQAPSVAPKPRQAAPVVDVPSASTETPAVVRPAAPRRATPNKAAPARDNDLARQRARDMYRKGNDPSAIAAKLKTSRRTVERWTQDLRQAIAQTSGGKTADDTEERHDEPISATA